MAPRKPAARKKRSTRRKNTSGSKGSLVMVGALVVVGAAALWASAQNKSPTAGVSQLLSSAFGLARAPLSSGASSGASSGQNQAQVQPRPHLKDTVAAPVNRPSNTVPPQLQAQLKAPLIETRPAATALAQPPARPADMASRPVPPVTPPVKPTVKQAAERKPDLALMPPAKPAPDDQSRHASGAFKVPKMIVAKQALVIRETAWQQAKVVGNVQKGREMRSYAKVGRWHRVVVPSTNIIGWVQEDQLIVKHPRSHSSPLRSALAQQPGFTTGSIAKRPPEQRAAPVKNHSSTVVAPLYPQRAVGKP